MNFFGSGSSSPVTPSTTEPTKNVSSASSSKRAKRKRGGSGDATISARRTDPKSWRATLGMPYIVPFVNMDAVNGTLRAQRRQWELHSADDATGAGAAAAGGAGGQESSHHIPSTLLDLLRQKCSDVPPQEWPARYDWGGIMINGRPPPSDTGLHTPLLPLLPIRVEFFHISSNLFSRRFQDLYPRWHDSYVVWHQNGLLVAFKPAGLPSRPPKDQRHYSFAGQIQSYLLRRRLESARQGAAPSSSGATTATVGKGGTSALAAAASALPTSYPLISTTEVSVHMPSRLDVGTCGLIALSSDPKLHRDLQRMFELKGDGSMRKEYVFVSDGQWPLLDQEQIICDRPITRHQAHPVLRLALPTKGDDDGSTTGVDRDGEYDDRVNSSGANAVAALAARGYGKPNVAGPDTVQGGKPQEACTVMTRIASCYVDDDGQLSSTGIDSGFMKMKQDNRKILTLVHARPLTGRTHQIRVHAASLGIPVCNDQFYNADAEARGIDDGNDEDRGDDASSATSSKTTAMMKAAVGGDLCLMSFRMSMTHPVTKDRVVVAVPDHLCPVWMRNILATEKRTDHHAKKRKQEKEKENEGLASIIVRHVETVERQMKE